uniref:DUF3592 domain-containing protein n=1 Tax=Lipingzhangella halophila TaxID=1783352 RepID=UPI0035E40925
MTTARRAKPSTRTRSSSPYPTAGTCTGAPPHTPNSDRNRAGQQVRVAYQPENPKSFTVGPPRRVLVAPVLALLFGCAFVGTGILLAVLA